MSEWDEIERTNEQARQEFDQAAFDQAAENLTGEDVAAMLHELLAPQGDEERRQRRLDLIAEVIALREYKTQIQETVQLLSDAGKHHVVATEALRQALGSVIDVLDELCMGLAVGQEPDRPWAEQVSASLSEHRKTLGFNEPGGE
jgi:hypothetical protein